MSCLSRNKALKKHSSGIKGGPAAAKHASLPAHLFAQLVDDILLLCFQPVFQVHLFLVEL